MLASLPCGAVAQIRGEDCARQREPPQLLQMLGPDLYSQKGTRQLLLCLLPDVHHVGQLVQLRLHWSACVVLMCWSSTWHGPDTPGWMAAHFTCYLYL